MIIEQARTKMENMEVPTVQSPPDVQAGNKLAFSNGRLASFPLQELPQFDEFVFESDAELDQYMADNPAPGLKTVFDTWPRTHGSTFYEAGSNYGGYADDWYYDEGIGSFVMPTNVGTPNAILSLYQYEAYEFSARLTSNNSDDDMIGLVMAAVIVDGNPHMLLVTRHQGGIPGSSFALSYYNPAVSSGRTELAGINASTYSRWSGRWSDVRIVRQGNLFTVTATQYNTSAELGPLTLDLGEHPELSMFAGKARYGFYTYSQSGSTYLNVQQPDSAQRLFSMESNRLVSGANGQWGESSDKLSERIGWPALVRNPLTGKVFFVHENM
tara:strand:+ start:62131 stop:63111 length:981 start_codon:yes stop_codon:yes gene_type:complete